METWQVRPSQPLAQHARPSADASSNAAPMSRNADVSSTATHSATSSTRRRVEPRRRAPDATRQLASELRRRARRRIAAHVRERRGVELAQACRVVRDVHAWLDAQVNTKTRATRPGDVRKANTSSQLMCHAALATAVRERVGQLRRVLHGLDAAHYHTVADGWTTGGEDNSSARLHVHRAVLLEFIGRLSCVVRALRQLPRRTAGRMGVDEVETYVRSCGAVHVVREVMAVLVRRDWCGEVERTCDVQPHSNVLTAHEVLCLFRATLRLSSEDVSSVAPGVHGVQLASVPSTLTHVHPMRIEEWCVRRWLSMPTLELRLSAPAQHPYKTAAWTRSTHPCALALSDAVSVVRQCLYCCEKNSKGQGGATPSVTTLRVPYGVGKAFVEWLLTRLARQLPSKPDTNARVVLHAITVHDLATLCAAVVFYRVHDGAELHVLLATARRCVEQVNELTGSEVASMLLAYASLKYDGNDVKGDADAQSLPNAAREATLQNFYLVLGTRAGQLADSMSEDDVVKVLRAFATTTISHDTLRASLESSLRMRRVHRSPTYAGL